MSGTTMGIRSAMMAAVCAVVAGQAGAQDLPVFDGAQFGNVVVTNTQSAQGRIRNEALIGAQNIEFISNYSPNSPFAQLGRAVGKLDILTDTNKFAPCTGFLVEGNKVVTNYHCVPGVLDHPQIGGNAIAAVQLHLGFTRDGIRGQTQSFHVSPVPLEMNEELDYTVLQVLGDANAEFGALALSDAVPEDLTPFWVIGHPLGEAQRISREKCQASVPAVEGLRVIHTCDTLPGSSGSPVIDTGLQQVVALHHASAGSVNLAVPMAEILARSKVLTAAVASGDDEATRALRQELEDLRAERDRLKADESRRAKDAAEAARLRQELAALKAEQERVRGASSGQTKPRQEPAHFANPADYEYNASHILLGTEIEAIRVLELYRGGGTFADLARQHSTGPSSHKGGALGWFGTGVMVRPFEEAVIGLRAGAVSDPVQTQFGWHVVKLNEVRARD